MKRDAKNKLSMGKKDLALCEKLSILKAQGSGTGNQNNLL
jgi:hypothetical protein